MTVPMNNTTVSNSNSSRQRAQHLYNKNVELESKRRKAAQAKIPSDPNAWQQMRENYESILLEDHAFSEQHDIEYALWQLHYKRIEELRAHYSAAQSQNGKLPARPGQPARITKIRSQFKTFLSEATGFYHDLMVKIRAKYGLSLGYVPDDSQNNVEMKKGLISCHRCFIYLGDLARYKGLYGESDSKTRDFDAASSYYKQAATLWPSSGNPHHQLAILASYSGDELLAVYRYFRSLAVDTPFTTARDNLIIAFEKNRQSYCQLLGELKVAPNKKAAAAARVTGKGRNKGGEAWVSLKDRKTEPNLVAVERESTVSETLKAFSIRFVRLNGILFTRTSLETFVEILSVARSDFLELLCCGEDEEVLNFGSDYGECKLFITRFIAVMIFTVYNANKETEHQSYAEILQRCVVLENAFTAVFDFMGLIVERCVQLKDPSGSFLLPGIMVFVEWLACCQGLAVAANEMEEKQVTARSLFWNQFVAFLNKMMLLSKVVGSRWYDDEEGGETGSRVGALPEDMELRGFLPLVSGQLVLDFTRRNYSADGNKERNARVQRIVAAGKALSTKNVRVGQKGLYFDSKSKRFLFGVEPQQNKNEVIGEGNPDGECEEEDEVIVFKPCAVPEEKEKHNTNHVSVNEKMQQVVQPEIPPQWMTTGGGEEKCMENGFSKFDNNLLLCEKSSGMASSSVGLLLGGGGNEEHHQQGHVNQESETMMIPSKFDSVVVMTTAAAAPSIVPPPSKTKKAAIKSPVSRPIRHFGPPPGFNSTAPTTAPPPKYYYTDEQQPLFGVNPRNGNGNGNPGPHVVEDDDYSWLDGYQQLPPYSGAAGGYNAADGGGGFGSSCFLPHPNKLLNTTISSSRRTTAASSLGMDSFPFPGKQASSVILPGGGADNNNAKANGWWGGGALAYHIPQHPITNTNNNAIYYHQQPMQQQQQQLIRKGNEQQFIAALPQQQQQQQQYQGQSLWEGRFFV